jgi:ADP-heptose:LPS heptosyltransferase
LSALAPLAGVSNVTFFSLQKGEPAKQLQNPPPGLRIIDWTDELTDFADTAALLDNLDLLISADTAPAHLAGALGKPVWVIAAFFADWRYMLGRSDNPWYSSMQVFRQPRASDWQTPVSQIAQRLQERVNSPS